jgi:hypothetical protein
MSDGGPPLTLEELSGPIGTEVKVMRLNVPPTMSAASRQCILRHLDLREVRVNHFTLENGATVPVGKVTDYTWEAPFGRMMFRSVSEITLNEEEEGRYLVSLAGQFVCGDIILKFKRRLKYSVDGREHISPFRLRKGKGKLSIEFGNFLHICGPDDHEVDEYGYLHPWVTQIATPTFQRATLYDVDEDTEEADEDDDADEDEHAKRCRLSSLNGCDYLTGLTGLDHRDNGLVFDELENFAEWWFFGQVGDNIPLGSGIFWRRVVVERGGHLDISAQVKRDELVEECGRLYSMTEEEVQFIKTYLNENACLD